MLGHDPHHRRKEERNDVRRVKNVNPRRQHVVHRMPLQLHCLSQQIVHYALAFLSIAACKSPTFFRWITSSVLNRMPYSFSTAEMRPMWASESQPGTCGAIVWSVRSKSSS